MKFNPNIENQNEVSTILEGIIKELFPIKIIKIYNFIEKFVILLYFIIIKSINCFFIISFFFLILIIIIKFVGFFFCVK